MSQLLTLRRTFVFAVFAGIFAFSARTATDPDLWWHLSTGKLIADTGRVPHTDPFSYTRQGEPWVAHEWLADVLIYDVYRVARWPGLILLFAALTTAAFLLLYSRCAGKPHVAVSLTLLGVFACSPVIGVRPQMLSFLLASLLLWLLDGSRQNPHNLWWIPFIFVLWVNLHAAFIVGIVILIVFAVASFASSTLSGDASATSRLFLVLVASAAAIVINPQGTRMYSYPFEVLQSTAMQDQIAEWFSPNFHQLAYLPLMLLILLIVVGLARSSQRPPARDLVLLLGSMAAALVSVRHIPLFVLIAVPLVAQLFAQWLPVQFEWKPPVRQRANGLRLSIHVILVCASLLFALVHWRQTIAEQTIAEVRSFPAGAVAFLKSTPLPSNVFVFYDWGGYLIWKLYPAQRVNIDGRADLYGDAILRQFADTYRLRRDWRAGLERACMVIVPSRSALAVGLGSNPEWPIAYQDGQATVFQRQAAPSGWVCNLPGTAQPGNFAPNDFTKEARILASPGRRPKSRSAPEIRWHAADNEFKGSRPGDGSGEEPR